MALGPGIPPEDNSSLEGTLPPSFAALLSNRQPPAQENVPQVTLPQVITTSLLATLAGALTDSPELAAQGAAGPFMRRDAATQRNRARQEKFESERQRVAEKGAEIGALTESREDVAAAGAESRRDVAELRAKTDADKLEAQRERNDISLKLGELGLSIRQGALDNAEERTRIARDLAETTKEVNKARRRQIDKRTEAATPRDIIEFRSNARDYIAQAAAAIRNTPTDEEVAWTMILPDKDHELESVEEIKDTILSYIDATLQGSPDYEEVREVAIQNLAEAEDKRRETQLKALRDQSEKKKKRK